MENNVRISLICNAGLLIEYGGIRILVDGIHRDEQDLPYSKLTPAQFDEMCRGAGPWSGADYLLFTHEHPDHITPSMVEAYLTGNRVRELFLPHSGSSRLEHLKERAADLHTACTAPGLLPGQKQYRQLGEDISLTAVGTTHMGGKHLQTENYSLLLHLGGCHILITGDTDYVPENFRPLLGERLDAVFVNPLFYHNKAGRDILDSLNPRQVIIYHIPFPEDDVSGYRRMVRAGMERHGADRPYTLRSFGYRGSTLALDTSVGNGNGALPSNRAGQGADDGILGYLQ